MSVCSLPSLCFALSHLLKAQLTNQMSSTDWIVKNSYGENWGIDGYIHLPKGDYNDKNWGGDCGILDDVSTVTGVKRGVLPRSSPGPSPPSPGPSPSGHTSLPLCDYTLPEGPLCDNDRQCLQFCSTRNSFSNFDFKIKNQFTSGKSLCVNYGKKAAELFKCNEGRCKAPHNWHAAHKTVPRNGCYAKDGRPRHCGNCKKPQNM